MCLIKWQLNNELIVAVFVFVSLDVVYLRWTRVNLCIHTSQIWTMNDIKWILFFLLLLLWQSPNTVQCVVPLVQVCCRPLFSSSYWISTCPAESSSDTFQRPSCLMEIVMGRRPAAVHQASPSAVITQAAVTSRPLASVESVCWLDHRPLASSHPPHVPCLHSFSSLLLSKHPSRVK